MIVGELDVEHVSLFEFVPLPLFLILLPCIRIQPYLLDKFVIAEDCDEFLLAGVERHAVAEVHEARGTRSHQGAKVDCDVQIRLDGFFFARCVLIVL